MRASVQQVALCERASVWATLKTQKKKSERCFLIGCPLCSSQTVNGTELFSSVPLINIVCFHLKPDFCRFEPPNRTFTAGNFSRCSAQSGSEANVSLKLRTIRFMEFRSAPLRVWAVRSGSRSCHDPFCGLTGRGWLQSCTPPRNWCPPPSRTRTRTGRTSATTTRRRAASAGRVCTRPSGRGESGSPGPAWTGSKGVWLWTLEAQTTNDRL